ncbi:hypothetical protein DI005_16455 [Prauserella sp. PE36]|uniref:hypothetical protein n=1 Tax=Prauserella sp. PE36 TaxID=1504709 RepID=UPI000DE377EE|nr:hypothetical protein [Prauserella sp. PE36]RBM19274.1 hypothetical protein DI005_16455 [Prauserella sp. PE36]
MTSARTLTDEEIYQLSPSQREEYFRQRAEAGVEDGGIAGWINRMVAQGKAGMEAQEAGNQRVQELSSGDVQYVEGLQPSGANYQGHDHGAMSSYVANGLDPQDVVEISDAYHELHTAFSEFATQLKEAVGKSQHEWEGAAADQAHGYFQSLSTWADGNSQNAQLASEVMYQQSEAATTAKNSMPEEVPFNWETEMQRWGSNPFNIVSNMNETFETYQRSQEAHSEAARVMTQYDNDLYTAASKQPVFAEPPKFGTGNGEGTGLKPPGTGISMPGNGGTDASGYSGGSIPGGSTVPGGSGGGSYGGGGSGPGGPGGGYSSPAPLPGSYTGSTPGTAPSGYRPPTTSRPRVPTGNGNSNFNSMGPMPMGPMGGGGSYGAGGSDYASKLGRGGAGGFGPGGSAGAGGAPGAGAASGAASGPAKPGMGPMGGGAAAPGAAAAAGRGGMGAAGMGAGSGRGQGSEDAEHQRPTYLVEGDPDEVFGTDQRTAPPVIGE